MPTEAVKTRPCTDRYKAVLTCVAPSVVCTGGPGALPIDPQARAKPKARMCPPCQRSYSQLVGHTCGCQRRPSRHVCALTATRRSLRELPLPWCVQAGPGRCPLILKRVQSQRLACASHASVATANSLATPVDANGGRQDTSVH